jgi:hypothetical protein
MNKSKPANHRIWLETGFKGTLPREKWAKQPEHELGMWTTENF